MMTVQQVIAIAHRARGFAQHLHAQGLIGRGNEVRAAVESLLSLETTTYPDFVLAARMEVADALNTLLDQHQYDAGRSKACLKNSAF